jgi:hypothetical protein
MDLLNTHNFLNIPDLTVITGAIPAKFSRKKPQLAISAFPITAGYQAAI